VIRTVSFFNGTALVFWVDGGGIGVGVSSLMETGMLKLIFKWGKAPLKSLAPSASILFSENHRLITTIYPKFRCSRFRRPCHAWLHKTPGFGGLHQIDPVKSLPAASKANDGSEYSAPKFGVCRARSRLLGFDRFDSLRKKFSTQRTNRPVTPASRTILTPIKNDLQMQGVP
jgi:hypothetical protein